MIMKGMKKTNTVTIFQTVKRAKLVTLPKERVEKDLGWITGDKLRYEIRGKSLILTRED